MVLYPVLMTLLTPLYIKYLGVEQYGIWMLAGNLALMMNALNMGVGESTIRLVSRNRDTELRDHISAAVSNNILVSVALLIMSVSFGAVISFNLSGTNFFNLKAGQADEAGYMILLLTASVGFRFIELVLLSVFKGFERFDVAAKLSALSRNGTIIGSIVLLVCGYGFIAILWLTIMLNVLNIAIQFACVRRFYPFIRFRTNFKQQPLSAIIQTNGWYWLQFVIGMTGFLADRFLIAHYTGMGIFGYYSIAAMIGSQLHSILVTFGTFVFPRVSYLNGQGNSVIPIYYKASSVIQGLGWFTICTLLITGPFVFRLWLGGETYSAAQPFIDWYLVYQAVILLAIVPYQFINGTSFVKFNSLFELMMRLLQIPLMIVFYYAFGPTGIIYALIAGALLIVPAQLFLFGKHVLRIPKNKLLLFAVPLLAILPMAFTQNVMVRITCALLTGLLYYKIVWPYFIKQQEPVTAPI